MIQFDINSFFTREALVRTLSDMPVLSTPVMDTIYKEERRRNHPLPTVAVADLQQPIRNIAVSRRGSNPVPLYGDSGEITHIEPQPLRPSERLSGVDVNNFKMIDTAGAKLLIDNKIDRLRRVVRASTEAMAAQSLKGKISYPMAMDGGFGTYEVDFGTTLTHTPATLWDDSGITIDEVIATFIEMEAAIQESSRFSGEILFWAGRDAFMALSKIVQSLDGSVVATMENRAINVGGYSVGLMNSSYTNPADGTPVKVVDDNSIVAVAKDAPFELVYAVLDDLDSNLVSMPFFVKPVEDKRTSSIELVAESKPLPVPYTKAVNWAAVTA
ncbi:major capsid protein [Limisalsivibrio acetivorans]|uniref:major capsid protein n=1 Tax=Limisalsivibrio acetivorans TaxID=1304888 RepID=UPI0003B34111|nr:major capsid protein [Limisalsivibrio acetivorans]